jgi:Tetratricopeptide repeat
MTRRAKSQITKFVVSVCLAALAPRGMVGVSAQEYTEREPLKYDAPVKVRLNKGEAHRYPLNLTAGQYIQVEGIALSGDITIELTAPDGTKLMKMKARNGVPEGNSVATVADETASYFVTIKARDPQKDGVEYQARMSELRPAKDADRARCRGEHLFAAGEEIYDRRTKDGYIEAIIKYQAALPHYEEAGDWFGMALAFNTIGEAYWRLNNYRDALTAFEQSLPLVRKAAQNAKTLSLEARITSNIGAVANAQQDNQKALSHYLQTIAIYRKLNNRYSEAICLVNIGSIYTATGQPEEALHWYERALPIYKELSNNEKEASVLNRIGVSKYSLGKFPQAIEDQKSKPRTLAQIE